MRPSRRIQLLKDVAKSAFPGAYARYVHWQYERAPLSRRIEPLLASNSAPRYYDERFEELQSSYSRWWPEYGFDNYSTWARGCERAIKLLGMADLRMRDLEALEVGCGDGMTSYALASYRNTSRFILNDTEDWRDARAMSFHFVNGNVCRTLPIDSNSFDLVMTYNAFEHVEDPRTALSELIRLCRSNGHIYIEFGPLYCSPLGLHAFSFKMPYPQFLFSPEFVEA